MGFRMRAGTSTGSSPYPARSLIVSLANAEAVAAGDRFGARLFRQHRNRWQR